MTDPLLEERYAFRELMIDRLAQDLEGPSVPDEVLDERPLGRYVTGILWPDSDQGQGQEILQDTEAETEGSADGAADVPVASSRSTAPTSTGLTFSVDTRISTTVRVTARAARYVSLGEAPSNGPSDSENPSVTRWQREPIELMPVEVDLSDSSGRPRRHQLFEGLELYVLARRPDEQGVVTVTAVLRNTLKKVSGSDTARDALAWFQVGLSALTSEPAIVDRREFSRHTHADPDLRTAELLYRNEFSFGAGHGCAVAWDGEPTPTGRVDGVRTEFIPRAEVARAQPGETDADLSLSVLSAGGRERVLEELSTLCSQYGAWIEARESGLVAGTGSDEVRNAQLHDVAGSHLLAAKEALGRMRVGLELLATDDQAFEAFQLANRAMHFQRARQDWVRGGANGEFELGAQKWRPFQIAFVLINLPSLTDRESPEREFADLLWFPAGGGKTEAYLALIAYLIVLRRLRDPKVEGTAVIMRYTLRLLTIQQFERAAMLICSLETVRREDPDRLGGRAFGIGLWVGGGSTPNRLDDARRALNKLRSDRVVESGNPMQLQTCPWCGSKLSPDDYVLPRGAHELIIRCPRSDCEFHGGLPTWVVDEDVYRVRPELVIGTVDKFARMAWSGDVATLFGRVEPRDIGPDLIIQDELHLISGPLGSTVGLYETAVDLAAGRTGADGKHRRPKLVASTATIRRADGQIRAVFDRDSRLFPPPGLNPDESFFARPAGRDELGTREYVGVMAPGTSHATLMVRVYASLLNTVAVEDSVPQEIRDAYWTLIGYFNSLRVLGSAYLQVTDDVASRLKLLTKWVGGEQPRRVELEELTSRRPSSEIPQTLKRLETGLGGPETPLDVVLATNMISVGLDVDRLGLMAVMGQPPSSAEYIQATSRVGRKHPGLVITIFNAQKSRDRSHYEGFTDFHRSLYRAVEATSATPFADRARDKALHAAFVSALRMTVPALRGDEAATAFVPSDPDVRHVKEAILARAKSVGGETTFVDTSSDLEAISGAWFESLQAPEGARQYAKPADPSRALLIDAGAAIADETYQQKERLATPWATPQSMRDVDAETRLYPARMTARETNEETEEP